MENYLNYITFILLFLVFRMTLFVHCETFGDIEISQVKTGLPRLFLRLRRFRVTAGFYLLCICAFRLLFVLAVVPILRVTKDNLVRLSFEYALCHQRSTWFVAVSCIILIVIYCIERHIQRMMFKQFHEEE